MATNKIFIPYYISNNTGAPAQVLPRVFFYNGLKESDPYYIQFWTTSSFGKTVIAQEFESFPYFDNYSGQETTTSSLSLLFLNEDVAYGNSVPSQSLYDLYWSKYVDLLYNPRTRIIRLSAVLPFPVYQKLELNDVIQLRSNYYHLRAINDYNLKTGECRMELLGPLLEGSLNNQFTFDNTCEQAPSISGSILNDTGSRQITFNITGSNCCNNPNSVVVRAEFGTGSCPQTASLTSYVTLPNVNPIVVNYASLLVGYPTVNCVTMSVANLCYGLGITGSYSLVFTGSLSGSFGNVAISASAQKNNCPVCQTGSFYTTIVSSGTFNSTSSQANANAQAVAYLTSVSQSNANTYGSCSINYYYNTQISASIQKNDCGDCYTGSFSLVTVPPSQSVSTCSLSEAQTNAQNYFNSVSQSWANSSGSCATGSTFCITLRTSFQSDVTDTSNFPVTMSLLYTASAATTAPSENDASWSVIGYISSSQNSGSINYNLLANVTSGSYVWIKPRSANNGKIQFVGLTTGNFDKFIEGPIQATTFGQVLTVPLESKPKLFNDYTQSLGNGYDIPTSLQLYSNLINNNAIKPLTASYIYTSSANFPDFNDIKWKEFNFYATASSSVGDEYVIITGSLVKSNIDVYTSQSNYYFFKFVDKNNNPINYIYATTGSPQLGYFTASISVPETSSIFRVSYINSQENDAQESAIRVWQVPYSGTIYTGVDKDVIDTGSLYPLTMSYYTAYNDNIMPTENSPSWSIISTITSNFTQSGIYITSSVNVAIPIQTSYNLIKIRGNAGQRIETDGLSGAVWNSTSSNEMFYRPVLSNPQSPTYVTIDSKPKLFNNYTQSIGIAGDIAFGMQQNAPNYLSASVSGFITASYIYTASSTFPSMGDAKWKDIAIISQSAGTNWRPLFYETGSFGYSEGETVFVSQSSYYFFKFLNASGSGVTLGSGLTCPGNDATASVGQSGSVVRISVSQSFQTDNDYLTLYLR